MKEEKTMMRFENEESKYQLLKRTIAKDLTDDEFDLFKHICHHTKLDPFLKQIYPIKRKNKNRDGNYVDVMTTQVGIDGLRSIAERTGNYTPGKETAFQYDKEGRLFSATAYVKKRTPDGTWHETSATAILSEYRPSMPSHFWNDKPHIMLSKCAEALVIRRAFPAITANLYTAEEMSSDPPVEVNPSLYEKVDCEPNYGHSESFLKIDLEGELIASQIPVDRLEEWVVLRAKTVNKTVEEVYSRCLREETLPKFKEAFVKWLESQSQAQAV